MSHGTCVYLIFRFNSTIVPGESGLGSGGEAELLVLPLAHPAFPPGNPPLELVGFSRARSVRLLVGGGHPGCSGKRREEEGPGEGCLRTPYVTFHFPVFIRCPAQL